MNNNSIRISRVKMSVTMNKVNIKMSKKEFDLLYFLAKNKGKVMSRESILQNVWSDTYVVDRTIDVHISKLRTKFQGKDYQNNYDESEHCILTIKGVGYKWNDESNFNIAIEDEVEDSTDSAQKVNDILLNVMYEDSSGNLVSTINVCDSKYGNLVIFSSYGKLMATPVKEFNDLFTLYKKK